MTIAKEHKAGVAYGLDEYEKAAIEAWAVAAEHGEIPGIEKVSKSELFAFFETISAGEWAQEMQRDPEAALLALEQYIDAAPQRAREEAGIP